MELSCLDRCSMLFDLFGGWWMVDGGKLLPQKPNFAVSYRTTSLTVEVSEIEDRGLTEGCIYLYGPEIVDLSGFRIYRSSSLWQFISCCFLISGFPLIVETSSPFPIGGSNILIWINFVLWSSTRQNYFLCDSICFIH